MNILRELCMYTYHRLHKKVKNKPKLLSNCDYNHCILCIELTRGQNTAGGGSSNTTLMLITSMSVI